jgi:hypothetical protein
MVGGEGVSLYWEEQRDIIWSADTLSLWMAVYHLKPGHVAGKREGWARLALPSKFVRKIHWTLTWAFQDE